jgi:hypothetical protein
MEIKSGLGTGWQRVWQGTPVRQAPRNGIYRPTPHAIAAIEMGKRCDAYTAAVAAYLRDEISLEEVYRCWEAPVFGAYGEKL